MKRCSKCKLLKSTSEFYANKTKKVGTNSSCKLCQNSYVNKHYKENKKYYINKASKNRNIAKSKAYKFLIEYCINHPCACGESDFVVLEFNHKDRTTKIDNISSLVTDGKSIEKIKNELNKCETMCANCHRRHTAKQMNWYKVLNGVVG